MSFVGMINITINVKVTTTTKSTFTASTFLQLFFKEFRESLRKKNVAFVNRQIENIDVLKTVFQSVALFITYLLTVQLWRNSVKCPEVTQCM